MSDQVMLNGQTCMMDGHTMKNENEPFWVIQQFTTRS